MDLISEKIQLSGDVGIKNFQEMNQLASFIRWMKPKSSGGKGDFGLIGWMNPVALH